MKAKHTALKLLEASRLFLTGCSAMKVPAFWAAMSQSNNYQQPSGYYQPQPYTAPGPAERPSVNAVADWVIKGHHTSQNTKRL